MKTMKRALAVLLAAVLLCVGVPLAVAEDESTYQVGDLIQFGTYPQTRVEATNELRNAANSGSWRSYNYPIASKNGTCTSDYMKYVDFFSDGVKYRAVRFEDYRPRYNYYHGNSTDSLKAYQNSNGYYTYTTYFFRYEPLTWRVLDPVSGLVMSEFIIDSQPFQNNVYDNGSYNNGKWYKDFSCSSFANDYSESYIRSWLNNFFYETAFSNSQKTNIQMTKLDYEMVNGNTVSFDDNVFLLSFEEALNFDYGFDSIATAKDAKRIAYGTEYADCQGLFKDTEHNNSCYWMLRSSADYSSYKGWFNWVVGTQGSVDNANKLGSVQVYYNGNGVRPACKLKQLKNNIATNYQLLSEKAVQLGDQIMFGTYPQSKVTDDAMIAALDSVDKTWTAYNYFRGKNETGIAQQSEYMYFCDFFMNGEKYRAVRFNDFRPQFTSNTSNSTVSQNGYSMNTVYYFLYEPLIWRVLDPSAGLIMCESVIDSQSFQNTYLWENEQAVQRPGSKIIGSDYSLSSIRDWLNYDFFETAFSPQQKDNVALSIVKNRSPLSSSLLFSDSKDMVFLLSCSDFANIDYGFSTSKTDETRIAQGTDYAKCQGLNKSYNKCMYWTRTAIGYSYTYAVYGNGLVDDCGTYIHDTSLGVRPVCRLIEVNSDLTQSTTLFSTYCQHINQNTFEAVKATCTEPGHNTYKYCNDCGSVITGSMKTIPALGHNYEEWNTVVEETCTEAGEKTRQCIQCGIVEEQTVDPLGHDFSIVSVSPASCKEQGFTTYTCSRCNESYVDDFVSPLDHAETTYTTPSTCAENGFTVTYCTRCGETLSHEILPRLEHDWNDGVVTAEPTCTAQGVKTFTCSGCGATYTEPVDMLAHDWNDGEVTKEPSCTEAGEMTYTCATGGETRTEPIEKLDHKIVLVPGKAPTCEEPGLTDGWQCETCKKWFAEQQPIDPTGHDMQIQPYVSPTCEEEGYAPFVCSRCGYTEKTDPEPALGHDYQPTYEWSADNSTVTASLVCTRCDDVQAKETVNTACKTVEATCMNPGLLTYTSEGFANKAFYVQTKTIEIAQKPHMTMQIREVSPTCDKEGVGSYWTCGTCDGIFEDEAATRPLEEPPVLPKLPHTPGEPVTENETAATCTAEGSYDTVVYCFACGAELSRETTATEMIPHADANNDGSCDTCGAQMQGGDHCKVCGKIHNGGFFDKLTGFFHRIIGIFKR